MLDIYKQKYFRRGHYSTEEIEKLRLEVLADCTLLELEDILLRPHKGLVLKLEKLAKSEEYSWAKENLLKYYKEYTTLHAEQLRSYRRKYDEKRQKRKNTWQDLEARKLYRQNNKEKLLEYKRQWRANRRKLDLKVT